VVSFKSPADASTHKSVVTTSRAAWRAANSDKIVVPPTGMIENRPLMYDHREGCWINMIEVNMGIMRTAVNTAAAATTTIFKVDGDDWDIDLTSGCNGIVFVNVENTLVGFTSTSDVGTMSLGPARAPPCDT
jgi:hypothetical protein